MVFAEGRLLFSCLGFLAHVSFKSLINGVVGDIRYSNDLGLMKRHGKLHSMNKGKRTFLPNIAEILKINELHRMIQQQKHV